MPRPDFMACIFLTREGDVYSASATLLDSEERVRAPEGHTTAMGCMGALVERVLASVDGKDSRIVIGPGDVS